MLPDLSNLDDVAAQAPESVRWQDIWNRTYPKNMWQTQTPPKGVGASSLQDTNAQLREAIEQQAERLFKATPRPHQYKMVIRHCRPDRTL